MIDDPIVEDVYRARQRILDECGGDLNRWIERLKAAEAEHRDRLVKPDDIRDRARNTRRSEV